MTSCAIFLSFIHVPRCSGKRGEFWFRNALAHLLLGLDLEFIYHISALGFPIKSVLFLYYIDIIFNKYSIHFKTVFFFIIIIFF